MLPPNRMPRIALVTPILPVPEDSTKGRYIFETASALARRAEVKVFFQLNRYPDPGWFGWRTLLRGAVDEAYSIEGLDVDCFSYPSIPFVTRLLNGYTSSRYLEPRLAAFAPDIVLAYWVYPDGFAALRAARALGLPCLIGALGSDVHVRSGLASWLTGQAVRNTDGLLTVSEAMRNLAVHKFRAEQTKVHTIVNGFNNHVFNLRSQPAARKHLGMPENARLIIYVGRLVHTKGLRELIDAFRSLAGDDPLCRLVLVGEGPMRGGLSDLIANAGLADRVMFTGGLPPARVADWICAADVLTLPSWSEGYPNVVVEALACGRPVVATDVGGTREIVSSLNGVLIPPRDTGALKAALRSSLDRQWDHPAIAARMKRTWDDVAAETLRVCNDMISRASRVAH